MSLPGNAPVVEITLAPGAREPEYASLLAAGADLRARLEAPLALDPGARAAVPTGIRMALPPGYEAQVRPRSGLALKKGVTCLNTPGTIDADYRGEVSVILINLGAERVVIEDGERVAQLVVAPVARAVFSAVEGLGGTARGEGGFGSTGTR